MSSNNEDRFPYPERATNPALAFFFSTYQARALASEFTRIAQGLDFAMLLNTRLVIEQDKEGFRKYAQENPQAY